MHFIKRKNVERDLARLPKEVKTSALAWLSVVEKKETKWLNFSDVRNTYARASQVGKLYVFDIKSYRLIVGINFRKQTVYYKAILSHSQYDKGLWKTKFSRSKQ
ncbi:MAG: type II toxin-antitoxin system HigB family toxin [Phormidesmis sp.]